jgi:hypothetical protein
VSHGRVGRSADPDREIRPGGVHFPGDRISLNAFRPADPRRIDAGLLLFRAGVSGPALAVDSRAAASLRQQSAPAGSRPLRAFRGGLPGSALQGSARCVHGVAGPMLAQNDGGSLARMLRRQRIFAYHTLITQNVTGL